MKIKYHCVRCSLEFDLSETKDKVCPQCKNTILEWVEDIKEDSDE